MPTRKTTLFYVVLIAIASAAVGMVISSQWGLSRASSAQTVTVPAANTAPLGGPIDATTFRNIAKTQAPVVVNIRTSARVRARADATRGRRGAASGASSAAGRRGRPRAAPVRRAEEDAPVQQGAGHGLHHRQGRLHPHQQPRRRGRRRDSGRPLRREHVEPQRASLRRQGDRPRRADRQRAHSADRDAVGAAARKPSSATRNRCSRATGSWPSATRST